MVAYLMLGLAVLFCILYLQGYLTIKSIGAIMFIGSIRGNGSCTGSFTSCAGSMRRIMRFRESRTYLFSLDNRLETGEVEVMVLNAAKQPVVVLNSGIKTASMHMEQKSRYYLVFTFRSASGSYVFRWE